MLLIIIGPGAVRVPPNILGLHMRFAKAQYGGHMGARFPKHLQTNILTCRKFAMLNLPRMKFYNPQLDIKVIRRPWQGKSKNVEAPCEANIIRG
jgi:Mitochondrial ribosomal protein L51 / S25 / CI-B8 domain